MELANSTCAGPGVVPGAAPAGYVYGVGQLYISRVWRCPRNCTCRLLMELANFTRAGSGVVPGTAPAEQRPGVVPGTAPAESVGCDRLALPFFKG
eukprot:1149581-Pelagomonas_calceolata.AAC.4